MNKNNNNLNPTIMKRNEIKQMLINAHFAGAKFCQENMNRLIGQDKEFMQMLNGLNLPEFSRIEQRIMREWYVGYDTILAEKMTNSIN